MSSDELVRRVRALGADERAVAVPLDEFLVSNDDEGSLAPNHPYPGGPQGLGAALRALAASPDAVFVVLDLLEYPDAYPEGEFPFAPMAYLASDRPLAELVPAVTALGAEPPFELTSELSHHPELPAPPAGTRYVGIFWD